LHQSLLGIKETGTG